jgi:acyl-CoA thioesterase I
MTSALVYHVASGQAFFSGIALISLAVFLAFRVSGRWSSLLRTVSACLGLILIAASATPLPDWFYVIAGLVSVAWIGFEGTTRERLRSTRLRLRLAVLAAWWLGVAFELPYHFSPWLPTLGNPLVYVVGDSISAGMNGEAETWPKLLARRHGIAVVDLSKAGADVSKAMTQADRVVESGSLVVAEIGGNDVLGATPPESFERDLEALLSRLKSNGRTVILLELPLPPIHNRYGEIQRRLARRHGVRLVPKRVLLGILTTGGATLDSVHLSETGQALMAETIWGILRPAFRTPQLGPSPP